MALPSTLGQPVPPLLPPWLVAWLRVHRSFNAACQIRVAVGAWWQRFKSRYGSMRHPLGVASRSMEPSQVRLCSSWQPGIDGTTDRQWANLNLGHFLWFAGTPATHRTLSNGHQSNREDRTPRDRRKPHGRIPSAVMHMGREASRSYVAHRAQLAHAAALSTFQTPLHMLSRRALAEIRRQNDLSGRYRPI